MTQSVRQAARRAALDAQAKRRRERAAAERTWSTLGIEIAVALSERDAAIKHHEHTAGTALLQLTRDEGLPLSAACEWANGLSTADAKRLLRIAETRG